VPRTFTSNLLHNLQYFFVGRYAGMLGYYFPGFFAMVALLASPLVNRNRARRPAAGWQWLVLASALAQGLIFVIGTPYTWSGGGVGNRYFISGYGVMLFLLPWLDRSPVKSYRYRGWISWSMLLMFAVSFLWLAKIGAGPGTDPVEAIIGRILTFLYFAFFITMPVWSKLDKTKPVPDRVTMHD